MRNIPPAPGPDDKEDDNRRSRAHLVERLRRGAERCARGGLDIRGMAPGYAYFSLRDASDRHLPSVGNARKGSCSAYARRSVRGRNGTRSARREVLRSSSPGLRSLVAATSLLSWTRCTGSGGRWAPAGSRSGFSDARRWWIAGRAHPTDCSHQPARARTSRTVILRERISTTGATANSTSSSRGSSYL